MSDHKFTADRSDMAHRIKTESNAERRDYDSVEQEMISNGRRAEAKVRWHNRTGR